MMPLLSLAVTVWMCVALVAGAPRQSDASKDNGVPTKQNSSSYRLTNSSRNVNESSKKYILRTTSTTTTTTQKPDLNEYDYYEYANDGYEKLSENKPEPTPSPVFGCPEITIICQQHCESNKYYSGYCEDKSCVCYGRIFR